MPYDSQESDGEDAHVGSMPQGDPSIMMNNHLSSGLDALNHSSRLLMRARLPIHHNQQVAQPQQLPNHHGFILGRPMPQGTTAGVSMIPQQYRPPSGGSYAELSGAVRQNYDAIVNITNILTSFINQSRQQHEELIANLNNQHQIFQQQFQNHVEMNRQQTSALTSVLQGLIQAVARNNETNIVSNNPASSENAFVQPPLDGHPPSEGNQSSNYDGLRIAPLDENEIIIGNKRKIDEAQS